MRSSGRRRPARALACCFAIVAAACSTGAKVSASDEAACSSLQRFATALADVGGSEALATLGAMRPTVGAASDRQLREAGSRFFEVLLEPVENEGDLTLAESVELGRLTRAEGAAALGTMIGACDRLGRPIHDLPRGADGP